MCIHARFFHLFIKFLINRGQDEEYGHLKHFEFSYAEWHQGNCRPVAAKNWREWKAELRQLENSFVTESPVAHLWQGESLHWCNRKMQLQQVGTWEHIIYILEFFVSVQNMIITSYNYVLFWVKDQHTDLN